MKKIVIIGANDFQRPLIQKAKELLMNRPETEIQHIAHQVGFQDASHFISVFRTATGYTPLEFRKLH